MKTNNLQLSAVEFQVLLALSEAPSYGYAIMKSVETQTGGRQSPEIGSLYRILSRLMTRELVEEHEAPETAEVNHRGLPRRYYGLTKQGRLALQEEARHLASVVEFARARDVLPRS